MQTLDDRRVLAAIVGSVFHDANDSLKKEAEESTLANRLVFVDQNDNSTLDQGEQYGLTDEAGQFVFNGLGDGTHVIRVFNGTESQVQTTPTVITANPFLSEAGITAVTPAIVLDAGTSEEDVLPAVFAKGTSLNSVTSSGSIASTLDLGVGIQAIWRAPSGELIALGDNSVGHKAFIVDAARPASAPKRLAHWFQQTHNWLATRHLVPQTAQPVRSWLERRKLMTGKVALPMDWRSRFGATPATLC